MTSPHGFGYLPDMFRPDPTDEEWAAVEFSASDLRLTSAGCERCLGEWLPTDRVVIASDGIGETVAIHRDCIERQDEPKSLDLGDVDRFGIQ